MQKPSVSSQEPYVWLLQLEVLRPGLDLAPHPSEVGLPRLLIKTLTRKDTLSLSQLRPLLSRSLSKHFLESLTASSREPVQKLETAFLDQPVGFDHSDKPGRSQALHCNFANRGRCRL